MDCHALPWEQRAQIGLPSDQPWFNRVGTESATKRYIIISGTVGAGGAGVAILLKSATGRLILYALGVAEFTANPDDPLNAVGVVPGAKVVAKDFDGKFAAKQILGGNTTTEGGREIMDHAARRMTDPPAGRATMTMEEIDQVLDTGDKIRKITPHPAGTTVTVQSTTMPGKPQVVVDAATGQRVITVIKNRVKKK